MSDISKPRLHSPKEHRDALRLRLLLNESKTPKWKRVQGVFNVMDARTRIAPINGVIGHLDRNLRLAFLEPLDLGFWNLGQ